MATVCVRYVVVFNDNHEPMQHVSDITDDAAETLVRILTSKEANAAVEVSSVVRTV